MGKPALVRGLGDTGALAGAHRTVVAADGRVVTVRVVPECTARSPCYEHSLVLCSQLPGAAPEQSLFPVRRLQKLRFPGLRHWRKYSVNLLYENTRGCLALPAPFCSLLAYGARGYSYCCITTCCLISSRICRRLPRMCTDW